MSIQLKWGETDAQKLRVITDTQNMHIDVGIDFDGYPALVKNTRNHLLGVIADIDWEKVIQRIPAKYQWQCNPSAY